MKTPLWSRRGAEPEGAVPKRFAVPAGLVVTALLAASYMVCAPPPREAAAEDPPPRPPEAPTGAAIDSVSDGLDDAAAQARNELVRRDLERRERELAERERQRQADDAAREAERIYAPGALPPPGLGFEVAQQRDPREILAEEFELQRLRRLEDGLSAPPVAVSARRSEPLAALPQPVLPDSVPEPFASAGVPEPVAPPDAASQPSPPPPSAAGVPTATPRPDPGPGWEVVDEGTILDAVLVTQIRGDFPGPAVAMVASPLWSRDRQRVLVPRGTRALGTAAPVSGFGQARLAISFRRLILPSGERVELQFSGLDQAGATGLQDKVNRHYVSTFGTAGALGVLAGLTQSGSRGPSAFEASDPRWAAGQRIGQASQAVFERYLNRPPTLTVRAGHRLRIHFTSDAALPRQPPP